MADYAEKIGSILIPDYVSQKLRADAGTIVASGRARKPEEIPADNLGKDSCQVPPPPGTKVLVLPYRGDGYKGFSVGKYQAKGVVRVYGIASTERKMALTDWSDAIVAELEAHHRCRPLGKWVLLRRDPRITTEMGLSLPENQWYRTGKGVVVDAGIVAQEKAGLKPGMRVHYKQDAIVIDTDFSEEWLEGDTRDYCFIQYHNIFSQILDE